MQAGSTAVICALPRLNISKLRAFARGHATRRAKSNNSQSPEVKVLRASTAPASAQHGDWVSNSRPSAPAGGATDAESQRRHIELPASKSESLRPVRPSQSVQS